MNGCQVHICLLFSCVVRSKYSIMSLCDVPVFRVGVLWITFDLFCVPGLRSKIAECANVENIVIISRDALFP